MSKSGAVKSLEQQEKDIIGQAKRVNDFQNASIYNGYTSRGDEYERKKKEAEKALATMSKKYQEGMRRATNLLK